MNLGTAMTRGVFKSVSLFKRGLSVLGLMAALGASEGGMRAGVSILLSPVNPTIDAAPGQVVNISLQNNDASPHTGIRGLQLVAKSGDGVSVGPTISSISLVEPGMFFASQLEASIGGGNDRTKADSAANFSADMTIPASGTLLLGSLTLDASGLVGPFDLAFGPSGSNVMGLETELVDIGSSVVVTIDNLSATHTLTVVPEPAETLLMGMTALAVFAFVRRRCDCHQHSVTA